MPYISFENKILDLKIHGKLLCSNLKFPTHFFGQQKPIILPTATLPHSRTPTSGCSWTMRQVKVGHSGGFWGCLKNHLEGDTTVVEVCVTMVLKCVQFFIEKKWLKFLRFQIGGVAWRIIIWRCFQSVGVFWEESFHPIESLQYLPSKCFTVISNHGSSHRSLGRQPKILCLPRTQNPPHEV